MTAAPQATARGPLTERQWQCVELLSHGYSIPQIGRHLYLTPNTVKTHLQKAYKALGVHGQAHAVRRCIERGILQVERVS